MSSAMSFRSLILLPVLLVVLSCSPSLARNAKGAMADGVYDADGVHWTILTQPERQACSLVMSFKSGGLLYIGLDEDLPDKTSFYFIFLKKGQIFSREEKYDVKIEFGKDFVWRHKAEGTVSNGYGGVYLRKLDSEFGVNFSQSGVFFVTIDGRDYGGYELTGAREGMLRMLACEDDMDRGKIPAR